MNLIFSALSSDINQTFRIIQSLNPEAFLSYMNDKNIYKNGLPLWVNVFIYSGRARVSLGDELSVDKDPVGLMKDFIRFGGDVNEEVETKELGKVPLWLAALNERMKLVGPSRFTMVLGEMLKNVSQESILKWRNVNTGIMSKAFTGDRSGEVETLLSYGFHHHPDENKAISQKILELSKTSSNLFHISKLSSLFEKSKDLLKNNPTFSGINLTESNEAFFSLIASPLESLRKSWDKSMAGPVIDQFDQFKNDLNDEQKTSLLKLSLHLKELSVAKHIAEDFGVSLTSDSGLKDVIPLLDKPDSEVFLKKIIERGWFNEELSGRFGRVPGLLAFSRSIPENMIFCNFLNYNQKTQISSKIPFFMKKRKPHMGFFPEEVVSRNFNQKLKGGMFNFESLFQKDENGKFILQQEREDNIKREKPLSYTKFPEAVGVEEGDLNWLAKQYFLYSEESENEKKIWAECDFSEIPKEILKEKCRSNPELIKMACQALIFDVNEEGEERVEPFFHHSFFKLSPQQNWVQHLDVLNEFLSLNQKEKIFSHLAGFELNLYNITSSFRDKDYQFDQFFKLFEELQQNPKTNWKEMDVSGAQRNFLKLDKEDCSKNDVMQKFKNVCSQALILVEKSQLISVAGVRGEDVKKGQPFKI